MLALFIEHLYFDGWYMARLIVKNEHQNDTCYNEIGLGYVLNLETPVPIQ